MQASALKEILEKRGHDTAAIFSGRSLSGKKPVNNESISFLSPFFITSASLKGISLFLTFLFNAILIPVYLFESIRIGLKIRNLGPDAVINFYDITGGLSFLFIPSNIRKVVISHHFFFEHPSFRLPAVRKFEKFLLLLHSRITSIAADKKIALSFSQEDNLPGRKLYIAPPLLRNSIRLTEPSNAGHVHIYTLKPGYLDDIEKWCIQHNKLKVRMFSDFREKNPVSGLPNLELHSFNEEEFVKSISSCSRVICTSGFETLAEALFLGKAVEVFPSENHYEQYCNSLDLERTGLGVRKDFFFPSEVAHELRKNEQAAFKQWAEKADQIIPGYLEA